jgi:hypothetical protein
VLGNHGGVHVGVVDDDVGILDDILGEWVADLEVVSRCWCSKDKGSDDCCDCGEFGEVGSHMEPNTEICRREIGLLDD